MLSSLLFLKYNIYVIRIKELLRGNKYALSCILQNLFYDVKTLICSDIVYKEIISK